MGLEKTHGGVKRSLQIKELLEEYDCVSLNPYLSINKSLKNYFASPVVSLRTFFFSIYLFFFKGVSIKGSFIFLLKAPYVLRLINKYKSREYVFEGGTTLSLLIIYYLAFLKIKYHILPQNIEYIVPRTASDEYFRSNIYKYSLEIESYRMAKSVTTVSNFDKAILDCHQIKSFLLPSYPSKSFCEVYASIASSRKNFYQNLTATKKRILLIGSTYNPPTREGLEKILRFFEISNFPYQVDLVGYGTSEFRYFNSDNINVLGSVSDSVLTKLMIDSHCLIINTIQTSGYLFKVVECNLSGLPIIFTTPFLQHENLEEYGIFNCEISDLQDVIENINPKTSFKKFKKPYFQVI